MPPLQAEQMLRNSVLVVAHPDDEALWFSSILDRVDEVIVCFLGSRTRPEWKAGRTRCIEEYPTDNISTLGLEQAGVFNLADWRNPVITPFGMKLTKQGPTARHYRENFRNLLTALTPRLARYRNVITHNPWGEYGHEEHVQIHQAVRKIQQESAFDIWFTNCCSNRSYNLMLNHIAGFSSDYLTLPANSELGERAMQLYKRHDCWTWYDDYQWFNEESFMKLQSSPEPAEDPGNGHIFPLNFIKMTLPDDSRESQKPTGLRARTKDWLLQIGEMISR